MEGPRYNMGEGFFLTERQAAGSMRPCSCLNPSPSLPSSRCQQIALVQDWRRKWHEGSGGETPVDFGFGICEIAPVIPETVANKTDVFAGTLIRWFQTGTDPRNASSTSASGHLPNRHLPNTFMAVTIDLGDATSPFGSVHCRWKSEVGQRLALAARSVVYEETSVDASTGPVFSAASYDPGDRTGSESVTLQFRNTGRGLLLSPMNISAVHSMGPAWNGDTPFEVCRASGSRPAGALECLGTGAMARGGDLRVVNGSMQLEAALAWCSANSSCIGFTAQSAVPQASCSDTVLSKVYFKREVVAMNPDPSWVSYKRRPPACGVLSTDEGWSLVRSAKVMSSSAARNDSVVLSGFTGAGTVTAVRFAWRAYPCEHLGCGLYADVTDDLRLPPPAFWAAL